MGFWNRTPKTVRLQCPSSGCAKPIDVTCENDSQVLGCPHCGGYFTFVNLAEIRCPCGETLTIPVNSASATKACGKCARKSEFTKGVTDTNNPLQPALAKELDSIMKCTRPIFGDAPEEAFVGKAFYEMLQKSNPASSKRPSILLRLIKISLQDVPVNVVHFVHGYCNFESGGNNVKYMGSEAAFREAWFFSELVSADKILDIWVCGQPLLDRFRATAALARFHPRFQLVPRPLEHMLDQLAAEAKDYFRSQM